MKVKSKDTTPTAPLRSLIFFLVLFVIVWTANQSSAQAQKGIAEAPKHLKAIVPPGNDIDMSVGEKTVGRRVEIPSKVRAVIDQVARRFYEDHCPEDNDCVGLKLYGPIFRLKAPQKRELFIFTLNYSGATGSYHLVMYDPVTKNVTQKPPSIDNKWIELEYSNLKKPIISFEDLGQDGHHQLTVTEVSHFGTDANIVSNEFFEIEPDLSLKSVFKFDTEMSDPKAPSDDRTIVGRLKKTGPGTFKVEKFLRMTRKQDEKLGEAVFGREKSSEPFRLLRKTILNKEYEDLLKDESKK